MSSFRTESSRVDEARDWICRVSADLLQEGVSQVRVRIATPDGPSPQAWVYRRLHNQWERTHYTLEGHELVLAVRDVLGMLATHPPADAWQVHRTASADLEDTDLQFDRIAVAAHQGDKLVSWVSGILFKDVRSSGQDRRRSAQPAQRR